MVTRKLKKKIEMTKILLDDDADIVKVMKATGLTEDELLRLRDEKM